MKKRVCIDISSIMPVFKRGYLSGIGRTTLEFLQALSKEKEQLPFDIVVFSQSVKKYDISTLNIDFPHKWIPFPTRYLDRFSRLMPLKEYLISADLWHIPHNTASLCWPNKAMFTVHDMILYACPNEFPEPQRQRALSIVAPLMNQSKAVLTCSQSSKNDIVKYLHLAPEKVHVVYWGIRHDLFFPVQEKDELKVKIKNKYNICNPYFFSVSCGYGRKNTLELLKNYEKLLENNPKNDLVIIWNTYEDDVKEIIHKSNGRIRVLSNVSDEELMSLYNLATATFYPSKYEGFGLPVLESMACGTPVVTSFNSSLPEVGGDAAIYIDSENPDSLYEIMCAFENDQYDIPLIVEKGVKQAAKFTWDKCAKETIKVYAKLLNE